MDRDDDLYRRDLALLTASWTIGLAASGWRPFGRATWWMEVAPVLIVLPTLWWFRERRPLTVLSIMLIGSHGFVLMLGGADTYARVPIGFVMQDRLRLARDPHDRTGHFMQGFVPAIVLRELLIRGQPLTAGATAFHVGTRLLSGDQRDV